MRRTVLTMLLALGLGIPAGCHHAAGSGPAARKALIAAWKAGGLEPSAFHHTTAAVGDHCRAGTVSKVDVLICGFKSADAARAAQDRGLKWVGNHTGASRARGAFVIAVADRHHADPHGKTIEKIFKLAPH